ncbi:MAG: GNAT family N-acetyltransferase [Anaerolineaceae bacterium]
MTTQLPLIFENLPLRDIDSIKPLWEKLNSLYVDEALRGQGVGRRLVEQHAAWLREKGCIKIRLAVSCEHESVLEFYHRCGFFERLTVLEYKDAHE